ncbi:MAG TPA: hypothetical protein VFL83_14860, partial [Anaeromyxobacter sp.]|nr:hypothetical protein [Anaeromyxobacter sp.]
MRAERKELEATDAVEARGEAAAPDRGPEPAPFRPEDVVPFFRLDLRVARGASPGLFEVSDPASGKSFTLYEFELAVARMLDG